MWSTRKSLLSVSYKPTLVLMLACKLVSFLDSYQRIDLIVELWLTTCCYECPLCAKNSLPISKDYMFVICKEIWKSRNDNKVYLLKNQVAAY